MKFYRTKTLDIMTENQISANLRFIESIWASVIFVIGCKIAPNFDGVSGAYILPVYEILQKCMYVLYILQF